jgi:hypothetical protein
MMMVQSSTDVDSSEDEQQQQLSIDHFSVKVIRPCMREQEEAETVVIQLSIELAGYRKTDMYATTIELTGCTQWYGSENMCNLLADHSYELFHSDGGESSSSSDGLIYHPNPFRMIELGSGMGRAGLMAMKLMLYEGCRDATCILSDGEDEVVALLEHNYHRNFGTEHKHTAADTGCYNNIIPSLSCSCLKLVWGDEEVLRGLLEEFPSGFDLIIGCDLIYGSDALSKLQALVYTVSVLLARREEDVATPIGDSTAAATKAVFAVRSRPSFFFAVTRRDLSFFSGEAFELLLQRHALTARCYLDEYTFDIFDNQVDLTSMFWRDTIVVITRVQLKVV